MMNCRSLVVVAALTMTACAKHPPVTLESDCRPLSEPLTTDSGAVSIACDSPSSDRFHISCTIRSRDGARPSRVGQFVVSGSHASDFDPYSVSLDPAGWDGCYTIYLRDGHQLEEVEIITDGASHQ
jgi:hypothetical protein